MSVDPRGVLERWGEPARAPEWMVRDERGRRVLEVTRGDTLVFLVQAVLRPTSNLLAPPAPQDVTLWTIAFTAKYQDPDPDFAAVCHASTSSSDATFPAGASITVDASSADGFVRVTMPPAATQGFPDAEVVLEFDVRGTDPAGVTRTIDHGHIIVSPGVTRFQPVVVQTPALLLAPKGDTGSQGPQGIQGPIGPQGPQGLPGTGVAAGIVFVRPSGNLDDWPAFMGPGGIVATASAAGQMVWMLPGLVGDGQWKCGTGGLFMPSNCWIEMHPDVVVNQLLDPLGGVQNDAFTTNAVVGGIVPLAANVVKGATQLVVTAAVGAKGGQVLLLTANRLVVQNMTIVAVSGTAPNITVTVDRPIEMDMTVADGSGVQQIISSPSNITINGNGARIQGEGEGFLHFLICRDVRVRDLNLVATNADPTRLLAAITFDTGAYNCEASGLRIYNGNSAFGITGAESAKITNCYATGQSGPGASGYFIDDSISIMVDNCVANGTGNVGLRLDGSPGNAVGGSYLCRITGGNYSGCSVGIAINDGANRNTVIGAVCSGNSSAGLVVQTGLQGTPDSNEIIGVEANNNVTDGFRIASGNRTTLVGCQANDNGQFDLNVSANLKAVGFSSRKVAGGEGAININVSAGEVKFVGATVQTSAHDGSAYNVGGSARVSICSSEITMDGAGQIAIQTTGTCVVYTSDSTLDGAASSVIAANINGGCTLRIGPNTNFSRKGGGGTINVAQPGGFCSRSFPTIAQGGGSNGPYHLQANGTTPVDFPFPDLRIEDSYSATLVGGTVAAGLAPGKLVPTYGASGKLTYTGSAAGDLGLYAIEIG